MPLAIHNDVSGFLVTGFRSSVRMAEIVALINRQSIRHPYLTGLNIR
jgi:hypothetical protein